MIMEVDGQDPSPPSPSPAVVPTVSPFISKLYKMVSDPSTDGMIYWGEAGNSFVISDARTFEEDLLPNYFKHSNISSFIRQLNAYGFRKIDLDRMEFANEGFLRGQQHLLRTIIRKRPRSQVVQAAQPPLELQPKNPPTNACVEVGKFGMDEEIESLKRDKDLLRQELVKLRQHQQDTEGQVVDLMRRLQVTERNQQQLLSLFAMAVQSPGFLAQLAQHKSADRRRVPDVHKRRHLSAASGDFRSFPEGQIVRYQPQPHGAQNSVPLLVAAQGLGVSETPGDVWNKIGDYLYAEAENTPTTPLGEDPTSPPEAGALRTEQEGHIAWCRQHLLDSPGQDKDQLMEPLGFDGSDFDFGSFLDQLDFSEPLPVFDDGDEGRRNR